MSNHFPIKNSPGCLESLALNESTDFASKNFILFAKVLRSLLAPRWTLHQVGSSPNFENFQINKRMGLTHPFIYEKTPQKVPESNFLRRAVFSYYQHSCGFLL